MKTGIYSYRKPFICGLIMGLFCLPSCKYLATDTASETQKMDTTDHIPKDKSYEKVILAHFTASLREQNPAKAYQYISQADREYKSRDEYVHEKTAPQVPQPILNTITFSVLDAQIRENSVRAEVELTHPDLKVLNQEIMAEAKSLALKPKSQELNLFIEQAMLKRLPSLPMTTSYKIVDLIREDGKWRIYYNWAKKIEDEAKQTRLNLGQSGPLAYDADLGHVNLTVHSIRFMPVNQVPPPPKKKAYASSQRFLIVDLSLTNHAQTSFSQAAVFLLANPVISASNGKTYPQNTDYIQAFGDTPFKNQFNDMPNLPPKESNRGEILFVVDKQAKNLKLTFDAGFNVKHGKKYVQGKRLIYDLGV